nr:PREDICTED: uncharacterized protein LOC109030346 [Bemisia tabaci]
MILLGSLIVVNLLIISPILCDRPTNMKQCREKCHKEHGWVTIDGNAVPIQEGDFKNKECKCVLSRLLIQHLGTEFKTLFDKDPRGGKEWLAEKGYTLSNTQPHENHPLNKIGNHSPDHPGKHSHINTGNDPRYNIGKHISSNNGKHSSGKEEKGCKRRDSTYTECRAECHKKHGWVMIDGIAAPILEGNFKDKKCECVISPSLISHLGERNLDTIEFTRLFKKNPEEGMTWLEKKGFKRCDANSDPSGCHSPDSPQKHSSSSTEKHSTSTTEKHSFSETGKHSARTTGNHASPAQESDASTPPMKRRLARKPGFKNPGQE